MGEYPVSRGTISTERFWQIAVLTTAGAIGLASPAEASRYYWSDSEPGFFQGRSAPQQRPQRARPRQAKKIEAPKDSVKPQGPLVIAISIEKQTVKVYDANGLFAQSPISTGMKGHPTPMGAFSIIQKNKFHRSNIYSGAPMPFMQRITWSGIAMHAGALPGYPASHGCIRMPMAFAARMWNWTKMGARVVIAPGEITPARFSHPLLAEQKVAPQPVASEPNSNPARAAKADKGASIELRPGVGHHGDVKQATNDAPSRPSREQTRTADARGASARVTMSDASPAMTVDPKAEAKSETANEAERAASTAETVSTDQPVETKSPEAATAEVKSPEADTGDKSEIKPDAPAITTQPSADAVKAAATEGAKPADDVSAADAKKDQTRLPNTEKAVVAKPEPAKPPGRIAVLVSRKDGKLYVRENFKPLFDVPVTIAPSERLLGTHVFTAEADKNDPNLLRWSAVSLPVPARSALKNEDEERASRRRKTAGVVPADMKPVPAPNSPAEALDRITIAPEAMARIAEALGTGSSIVVSDQGINQGGETGEGTDFIVPLR